MIIRKYSCKRFAGIKDKDIEFKDGLNIILGPNEAGKSTIVEGIENVLFRKTKLKNNKKDRNFKNQFMPLPNGDSIDGHIIMNYDDKDYSLKREWGEISSSELKTPNGHLIKNENEIQNELNSILKFGQGTYSALFFSKQADLKKAIDNIIKNEEETNEISSLLRKTIMELDGVSIEKLRNKIDGEIKDYFSNWDIEKNSPKNGRGISNPYKREIGKVLQSFYDKENLKLKMDMANTAEDEFKKASDALRFSEETLTELKLEKESMEELEEDVTKRLIIEPKIEKLLEDLKSLTKINEHWPQNKLRLEQLDGEIRNIDKSIEELKQEENQSKLLSEKNSLIETLNKVDNLKKDIGELKNKISEFSPITKEDLDLLEKNYNEMLKTEAMINAGIIIGQLNYFNGESPLMVTKDLDDMTPMEVDKIFKANGYIKLNYENIFELELKTGEEDFSALRQKYEEDKKNYSSILLKLNVSNIAEAKTNKDQLDLLNLKINSNKDKINNLLGNFNYDELKEKIDSFGDLNNIRSIDTIQSDISTLNEEKLDKVSENRLCQNNISNWEDKYGDISGLFKQVISITTEKENLSGELKSLKPLPKEFDSAESFRKILSETREKYDHKQEAIKELRDNYFNCEVNLPDITYEELLTDYKTAQREFNKNIEKGKRLLKIKNTFDATREKMDENSFTPVINLFSKYLEILTNGDYNFTDINDDFEISICKSNELTMPISLLSSGTYDSVALALRLSILEYILGDEKGFLVLDDCFVDLDPERKEIAIKLINKFAKNHQVIFTTCSPDTAKLLNGNLILI